MCGWNIAFFQGYEEHYSLYSEPGGAYLCHVSVDPNEGVDNQTAVEQLELAMYEKICFKGIDDTLLTAGGYSTNVNTGWKGGVIQFPEKNLEKILIWFICAFSQQL